MQSQVDWRMMSFQAFTENLRREMMINSFATTRLQGVYNKASERGKDDGGKKLEKDAHAKL